MPGTSIDAVTGAFGYSGKYITRRLLTMGRSVITLTNSPGRANEFGGKVEAFPLSFDQPDELARSLQKVEVLYNTYWVRFNHRLFRHADAIRNTIALFDAARRAGVRRIVHISITNSSESSPLEYFSGKSRLEKALIDTGISYAILRPAVIFGKEDILINNIAWTLRHFPVFAIFGDGQYRLQPIYIEDLAELAIEYGEKRDNVIIDAIGPETFTYRELVETIGRLIGARRPLVSVPPLVGYCMGQLIGLMVGDVMITRPEIEGLMANLLYVKSPPAGTTSLSDWIELHAETLGRRYTSELARRVDRRTSYQSN